MLGVAELPGSVTKHPCLEPEVGTVFISVVALFSVRLTAAGVQMSKKMKGLRFLPLCATML